MLGRPLGPRQLHRRAHGWQPRGNRHFSSLTAQTSALEPCAALVDVQGGPGASSCNIAHCFRPHSHYKCEHDYVSVACNLRAPTSFTHFPGPVEWSGARKMRGANVAPQFCSVVVGAQRRARDQVRPLWQYQHVTGPHYKVVVVLQAESSSHRGAKTYRKSPSPQLRAADPRCLFLWNP